MKKRLLTLAAFGALCVAGLTSCAEQIPTVHYSALTVTKDEGVASVDIARADGESGLDLTSVLEGTELVATVTLNDWYVVDSIVFDGEELSYTVGQTEFEFYMPTHECSFEVNTYLPESAVTVTNDVNSGTVVLSTVEGENATVNENGAYHYGETARISATSADADSIKIIGLVVDGNEIEWDGSARDFLIEKESYALEVVYSYKVTTEVYFNALTAISNIQITSGNDVYENGDFIRQNSEVKVSYTGSSSYAGYYEDAVPEFYLYQNDEGKHATTANYVEGASENVADQIIDTATLTSPVNFAIDNNRGYVGTAGYAIVAGDIQHAKIYGLLEGDTFSGATYFTIVRERGYTYSVSFADPDDGTPINFTIRNPNFNGAEMARITVYGVTQDAVLNITATEAVAHNITYTGKDGVKTSSPEHIMGDYAVEGETVEVYGISSANSVDNTLNGVTITGVESPYVNGTLARGYQYSFTMGTSDVNIAFSYVNNIPVTVNEHENVSYISVRNDSYFSATEISTIAPGLMVYVFALATEGYAVTGGTANEGAIKSSRTTTTRDYNTGTTYTVVVFEVPATATELVVTLEVAQLKNITVVGYDSTYFGSYSFNVNGVQGGGNSSALPGSSVYYSISLNYSYTNSHYISVSYSYNGQTVQLTSGATGYANGNFTMPDYDVTFTVQVLEYDKISVTATVTGEVGQLTSYAFSGTADGTVSGSSYSTPLTLNIYVLRSLSASISVNSGYKVTCTYTVGGSTQTLPAVNIYNGQYSYQVSSVPENLTAINFNIEVDAPVNVTEVNETGDSITLTYTLSGATSPVVEKTNIFAGSVVQISVNETAPDGFIYQLEVSNGSGSQIASGNYSVTVSVIGDFTVTITKVSAYSVTINFTGTSYVNYSVMNYSTYTAIASNYNPTGIAFQGTQIYATCYYYGNGSYDLTLTIGGTAVLELKDQVDSYNGYDSTGEPVLFEVTGNVVLTITEHAAA